MKNCFLISLFILFIFCSSIAHSQDLVVRFDSFLCDTLYVTIRDQERNQILFKGTVGGLDTVAVDIQLKGSAQYHIGFMSIIDVCGNNGMSFPFLIEPNLVNVSFRDSLGVRFVRFSGSPLQKQFNEYNSKLMQIRVMDMLISKQLSLFKESDSDSIESLLKDKEILNHRAIEILKTEWRANPEQKFNYIFLSMLRNQELLDQEISDSICATAQLYATARQIEELCSVKENLIGMQFEELILPRDLNVAVEEALMSSKRWILIEFWASWCAPCLKAQKSLVEVFCKEQKNEVSVVSVSVKDTQEKIDENLIENQVCWQNIDDYEGAVLTKFGNSSIPFYVLVDSKGILRDTYTSFNGVIDKLKSEGITFD